MDSRNSQQEFFRSVEKLRNGEAVSYEEYLMHFEVQNSNVQSGPAIGVKLPHFSLPDQDGRQRTLADLCGPNGLLLVFVRSTNWCGYCRNQLAELNLSVDDARQRGVNVAAMCSDAPDLARDFAKFAGIRYPILADPGAVVIERLGVLNTNIPPESTGQNDGRIAFPGHMLIAPDGTVRDKLFTDDLRHRASGADLVSKHYGPGSASAGIEIVTEELRAEIVLATGAAHTGQEIAVLVKFHLKPGWHVYGTPLPARYVATSVLFDEELIERQQLTFPAPQLMTLKALGETLPVYEGTFAAHGAIRLRWSPPVHGSRFLVGLQDRLQSMQMAPGDYKLKGTLRYQACGDANCLMPESIAFELPLRIVPDIDKVRPYFKAELDVKTAGAGAAYRPGKI